MKIQHHQAKHVKQITLTFTNLDLISRISQPCTSKVRFWVRRTQPRRKSQFPILRNWVKSHQLDHSKQRKVNTRQVKKKTASNSTRLNTNNMSESQLKQQNNSPQWSWVRSPRIVRHSKPAPVQACCSLEASQGKITMRFGGNSWEPLAPMYKAGVSKWLFEAKQQAEKWITFSVLFCGAYAVILPNTGQHNLGISIHKDKK